MKVGERLQTAKEALIETALRRGEGYNAIAKELRVSAKTIAKVAKRMNEVSPKQALDMFEKGISPMEIVKRYNSDPKTIAEWCQAWVTMNQQWEAGRKYVKVEHIEE